MRCSKRAEIRRCIIVSDFLRCAVDYVLRKIQENQKTLEFGGTRCNDPDSRIVGFGPKFGN